jgi:hypothetical protein
MRNGAIQRLPAIKRGLFSAAIDYSRLFGVIRNTDLIRMLDGVAERIGKRLGRRIWDNGLSRAASFLKNGKIMRIFPSVRRWINQGDYVFWLGTTLLNNMRRWITLPYRKT